MRPLHALPFSSCSSARLGATFSAIVLSLMLPTSAQGAEMNVSFLDHELGGLEEQAGGRVGAAVALLGAEPMWSHRGNEAFPLERVSKLVIALALLAKVDRREIHLDEVVEVRRNDLAPDESPITAEFTGEPEGFSVRGLLARAITLNDNTAADVLTRRLGGPAAVTAQLRRWGDSGIRVDRLERERQTSAAGLTGWQPDWVSANGFENAVRLLTEATRRAALRRYLQEPADTATPLAMVDLLARWGRGLLLSPKQDELLEKLLTDSPRDQECLREGLPAGWKLVHQTGPAQDVLGIGPATNDVGVFTSPKNHKLLVAVFIAGSAAPLLQREKVIAQVARAGCAAVRE